MGLFSLGQFRMLSTKVNYDNDVIFGSVTERLLLIVKAITGNIINIIIIIIIVTICTWHTHRVKIQWFIYFLQFLFKTLSPEEWDTSTM